MLEEERVGIHLSVRAVKVLSIILSRMTEQEVLNIQGCGSGTLNEIQDEFARLEPSFRKFKPGGFKELQFDLEKLKTIISLNGHAFLVRYRDEDFIVIEYRRGTIYKLPIKELGETITVRDRGIVLRSIPISRFIVGAIIQPRRPSSTERCRFTNRFWRACS